MLDEIENAKLSFKTPSAAQPNFQPAAPQTTAIVNPQALSTTSYANDNHLPDAKPEKSQEEEDPFASLETQDPVPLPALIPQKRKEEVDEDPFVAIDTPDPGPKMGFFASTIAQLGSKISSSFSGKEEPKNVDAYGRKIITPGSGGLPLTLTGFTGDSVRPSVVVPPAGQRATKPAVVEDDPFGRLAETGSIIAYISCNLL